MTARHERGSEVARQRDHAWERRLDIVDVEEVGDPPSWYAVIRGQNPRFSGQIGKLDASQARPAAVAATN
jgi:hypothetical protein